jgi:CheY-like chemotaxis protein
MLDKPKTVSPSTLRTVAQAVDFFIELCKPGHPLELADNPPVEILIVDDEVLSRRAIVYALEKAFLKASAVEDAQAALARTQSTKFDLVFIDVHLPGIHGFELCDKLRENGPNKTTPNHFRHRHDRLPGAGAIHLARRQRPDCQAFMFIELTVKALTFALRHRIELQKQARAASQDGNRTRRRNLPFPCEELPIGTVTRHP